MKKISVILPVYNESILLPLVLSNIEQYVDEIVVVDGGPEGKSSDETAELANNCDKVVYSTGVFRDSNGGWDSGMHKNTALNATTGDVIMILSADMIFSNMDILVSAIQEFSDYKMFFVSTIEFWMDIGHVRLYSTDGDAKTIAGGLLQLVVVDRSMNPYFDDYGNLVLTDADLDDRMLVPNCIKYHLGWIRAFDKQVDKHIMHVKQLRWGEHGDKLLSEGDKAVEQWAIRHVLSYPQIPSVSYGGGVPQDMKILRGMKYNNGYKEILGQFEERYGSTPFQE